MRRPIQDEFTYLQISRQRKYQLRQKREGRCSECGQPTERGSRCLKHLIRAREDQRKKRGMKGRYKSLSYRLEEATRKMGRRGPKSKVRKMTTSN